MFHSVSFFIYKSIGFAIVQRLASEGAKVVISSRKVDNVMRSVEQLKAEGFQDVIGVKCHVGSADDRRNLFAETIKAFGGLDILVSNAAVNPSATPILDTPESSWDKIFEINVKAAFLLAQEARPLILKQGGGSIIFISSIAGYQSMPVHFCIKTIHS